MHLVNISDPVQYHIYALGAKVSTNINDINTYHA